MAVIEPPGTESPAVACRRSDRVGALPVISRRVARARSPGGLVTWS